MNIRFADDLVIKIFLKLNVALLEKSKENIALVENSVRNARYYSAVAGRAYYSVFQSIKHYLLNIGFDYNAFLREIGKPEEQPFSHGTIQPALTKHLLRRGMKLADFKKLNYIGSLYRIRLKADYEKPMIKPEEVITCLDEAKQIINIIDGLGIK